MKHRRIGLALLLGSLALILATAVYSLGRRLPEQQVARLGSAAPVRAYVDAHGSPQRLPGDRPMLLLAYREGCNHCLAEFAALRRNQDALAGTDIVLLTTDHPLGNAEPADLAALKAAPGVFHGVASPREIFQQFGTQMTPAILIYRHGVLEARFVGETPIHVLAEALHRTQP